LPRIYRFVLLLAVVYVAPVVAILAGVLPFAWRFRVLVAIALVMVVFARLRGHRPRDLGIRSDNLRGALIAHGALSAVLVALLGLASYAHLIRAPTPPDWSLFYLFYVFVSSPAQEFLYRGLIFAEMNAAGIASPLAQVLISAANYCFLHAIYRDSLTLAVTLALGLIWGAIYRRLPNLWAVSLSHAVLGAISIAVGVI